MELRPSLLVVKEASIEDNPDDESFQTFVPKSYLRAYGLVPVDTFSCVFGPTTKIDGGFRLETPYRIIINQ